MTEPERRTRNAAVDLARSQIGVTENPKGSNWGPVVAEYLKSVGIHSPAPWCAAFVYWVFQRTLGAKNPLPKTGYTPLILRWAKEQKRIIPIAQCQPGDLVLFYYPHLKRVGHVGIVALAKPDHVWTIEGNTNDDGTREGWKVCRRKRAITKHMIGVNAWK